MEKWLQKVYDNWGRYLVCFLAGVVVFLVIVHILFKIKLGIYWIEAEWSVGDILSFSGTILSFVGTIVLGCITAKISIDNNNINMRLAEIEKKRENLEEDKRLGYIIPKTIKTKFFEHSIVNANDMNQHSWIETEVCTARTETVFLQFNLKLTSESVINKITCNKVEVCQMVMVDDVDSGVTMESWIPFYVREEKFNREINQIDNTFEENLILSKSDRDISGFQEMKNLLLLNAMYMINIEFEYINTLQEKRIENLQLICCRDSMLKSEIQL